MTRTYFRPRTALRAGPYDVVPSVMKISQQNFANSGKLLFHYTNMSSFVEIVNGKELWISNALNMNDAEEISFAIHALTGFILENSESSEKQRQILEYLNYVVPEKLPKDTYIFSLSEKGSALSQWRAYAQPEGLSFGWSQKTLEQFAESTGGRLIKVAYEWAEQSRLIKPLFEKIDALWEQSFVENIKNAQKSYSDLFEKDFNKLAPMMKHEAFYEEQEHRIIWDNTNGIFTTHFSSREFDIKPFIKIALEGASIEKFGGIHLGPTRDIHRRFYEIQRLLDHSEFDFSAIWGSGIPFQRM